MRFSPICTEQDAEPLRTLPAIAVDVGFAQTGRKTCGVASTGNPGVKLTHQQCLEHLSGWIGSMGDAVVILEAPLSLSFGNGNPSPRGPFERTKRGGKTLTRYWYSGPGAAVTLGASNILRRLAKHLKKRNLTIHLLEGFVSFNSTLDHHEVAEALRDSFIDSTGHWHTITEGDSSQSLLDFLNIEGAPAAPGILESRILSTSRK